MFNLLYLSFVSIVLIFTITITETLELKIILPVVEILITAFLYDAFYKPENYIEEERYSLF